MVENIHNIKKTQKMRDITQNIKWKNKQYTPKSKLAKGGPWQT